ncbi:hypothetical protein [Deltalipothrixvirus pozzuoliense]|uniref:Uncharacterized protein ORF146 n=1 Tax=Acidianus filamentous virus 2 (isolate Italy/Pozzuoli) TaxID=654910 RepID=Y146_AFV2P|nr:hypothetical protein AFV2_gp46 [Acidianus filamentous virus 2]Q573C3.1 RecName: Full=Uncharacterized protein ORF146 [Acidianus filamentous virus 2 (isolate Pozzuoli)]CAH69433.1 hypothetical protein [Acidianus filamentous virus 2]
MTPAVQNSYIAFLISSNHHDPNLFLLLQNHASIRVMVRRRDIALTTVNEDDVEYEYEHLHSTLLSQIFGIADAVYPNPSRHLLIDMLKYSGYDNVDDWISDFCSSLPRNVARRSSYLCLHHGHASKWHNNKNVLVYLVTVVVNKIV